MQKVQPWRISPGAEAICTCLYDEGAVYFCRWLFSQQLNFDYFLNNVKLPHTLNENIHKVPHLSIYLSILQPSSIHPSIHLTSICHHPPSILQPLSIQPSIRPSTSHVLCLRKFSTGAPAHSHTPIDIQLWWTVDSKLSVGVSACLPLYVAPAMNCLCSVIASIQQFPPTHPLSAEKAMTENGCAFEPAC